VPANRRECRRKRRTHITEEDEAAWAAALEIEQEAFEAFTTLPPVTMPGLRAAVHYLLKFDAQFMPEGSIDDFLTALLDSPLLAIGAQKREAANG
jgi:hypothetical protein